MSEAIARVCHEVIRAYCASLGDLSQPTWEDAPDWQRQSAIRGVLFAQANPGAGPAAIHDGWMEEKRCAGWKHGPQLAPEQKEHPCLVPYDDLPPEERTKDYLFLAVVRALSA
ncbi:hypothetical protein GXW71_08995 [Roseomonas hellenica]|uniref:Ryanodine receptor Ryr domain-containing protein n=1 Tax=Plastoroseomonas hellenica TaxID=2687306 RepID=A0ABS5EW08_9PROT|nr:hypothetical protein [Plastoroseomonas hellenica]